ncbi:MAG: GNAT family N-acetyltransferase [Ruminococcus sp.]|nr:GNAT family N-acetyltransferase [Ruminococcus sp.]
MLVAYPYTFDEARVHKWIETNIERYHIFGFGLWAVCLKDTGEMIGDCILTMQNIGGFIRPEIGYHIRADQQRCGYAREAASSVRDWVFSHPKFRIVYSYMRTENIPSTKTAESISMSLIEKYTDDGGAEISVYAIERMKNE